MTVFLMRQFVPSLSVLILVLFFSSQSYSDSDELASELDDYISVFSNNNFEHQKKHINRLTWAGISDPRIYDIFESKVLSDFQSTSKKAREENSRYIKTLGLSGNEKYRPTLNKVLNEAKSKKIQRHTKTALIRLEQYKAWNPVISSNLDAAPIGQLEQTRVNNMLRAEDLELVKIGAKRVYYAHNKDKLLVELAKGRLVEHYKTATSQVEVDTMAWLCKALASSGDASYRPLLMEVTSLAPSKKLSKYAKKYAALL